MTLVEIMVAFGLLGAVAVGLISISKNQGMISQNNNSEGQISEYVSLISSSLNNKITCDQMIPSLGTLVLSTIDSNVLTSVTHVESEFITPPTTASVEVLPVSILLKFDKKSGNGTLRRTNRKVSFLGQFKNGVFVDCVDYESHAIQTSFKIGCETIGGQYNFDGTNASCDYSQINEGSAFAKGIREYICTNVYGGSFDSINQRCLNMKIDGEIRAQNITPSYFMLNGKMRTSFNQACTGENTFITTVNVDGSVACRTVSICTKGLDCNGEPPVVVTPPPSVCSDGQTRIIEGEGTMCSCPVSKPYMCNPRITQVCSSGAWKEVSCITGGCEAMSCI